MDVVTSVRDWLVHGSATPMQEAFICRDAVESILPDAPAGRPRSPRASPLSSTYVAWRMADTAGAGAAAVLVACPSRCCRCGPGWASRRPAQRRQRVKSPCEHEIAHDITELVDGACSVSPRATTPAATRAATPPRRVPDQGPEALMRFVRGLVSGRRCQPPSTPC